MTLTDESTFKQKLRHPAGYMRQCRENKSTRRAAEHEQEQWQRRWAVVLDLWDESHAPVLEDEVSYPSGSDDPTCQTLLFRLKAGQQFADVEGRHRKLASCLGTDRLVIERYVYPDDPTRECTYAFTVSHEKSGGVNPRLGIDPHLHPGKLHPTEQQFAVRWALGTAFSDVGLQTPIFIKADLKLKNTEVEWFTKWALPGTMSYDALDSERREGDATLNRIKQHLGCDSVIVGQTAPKTFYLTFSKRFPKPEAPQETVDAG